MTPSLSGFEVVGDSDEDLAINVGFDSGDAAWFAPQLVEVITGPS
jgi:hypothetical protein